MADPPHFVKYAPPMIRVRLFAGLRERAGWSERELDGIARVADVWPVLVAVACLAASGVGRAPVVAALRAAARAASVTSM